MENENRGRILVLANMYPSKKYPFYGVFVQNTNRILENAGYEVNTVAVTKTTSKLLRVWKYFLYFFRVIFNIVFVKNDLVYVHYPAFSAIPLAFIPRMKYKLIVNIHGNDLVPEESKDKVFLHFTDIAVEKADYIILPSFYFKRVFQGKYPTFPSKNIFISPSGGVDRKLFKHEQKGAAKKKIGVSTDFQYIGFVSRIEKNKGWDMFVKMISIIRSALPGYRFIIVGSGSEEKKLEEMIREKKLDDVVIKYDYLSHDDLVNVFNAIDILCFPSLRKSESLGLVGLEAMACKTIVISSSGTGPESYIENNVSGFIVQNLSARALADEVIKITRMPEKLKFEIQTNAAKHTEMYAMDEVATKLTSFINLICKI